MIAALAAVAKKSVAVVRSSGVGSGVVARNVEVNDDKLGFIASMELAPAKSRLLLVLGLMNTTDPAQLQRYFMEY
jgi:L-asparaginase